MIAYANLGQLGAREGRPVVHTWEPPPPEPLDVSAAAAGDFKVLPWLLILLPLFLLRRNRSLRCWWIWLPVVVSAGAGMTITCQMTGNEWGLANAVGAFVVGLAALWLLLPFLGCRYRIVAFLKALLVVAGFSLLAYVPTLVAEHSGWIDLRSSMAGLLALASLAVTLALTFGGVFVRRRFGRIRFLCWLAVWMVLAWVLISTPFVILAALQGHIDWGELALPLLAISGLTLALLLPLVLLSFFQPFYRDRFLGWLNLPPPGPMAGAAVPPVMPEAPLST